VKLVISDINGFANTSTISEDIFDASVSILIDKFGMDFLNN